MFGCTVQLESKETNLGSSDLRDFSINRQNYRGSFSAMVIHGHASLQLFWGVDTSDSLGVISLDSTNHIHGLTVYVNEGLPLACDLSQENSVNSYLCFRMALPHSVSYFFFLSRSPSVSSCMVFDFISSKIDELLSVNPPANVFVFGGFNTHHKDWLTYSGGTARPSEFCNN